MGRLHEVISSLSFRDVREDPLSKGGPGRAEAEGGRMSMKALPRGEAIRTGAFKRRPLSIRRSYNYLDWAISNQFFTK